MKIALVHDWLTGMRGGEKVLEALCEIYPDADIYTLFYIKDNISPIIKNHRIYTSFIGNLPLANTKYRYYLPLMPLAVERFNLKEYDLIISSSHCVAKGAIPSKQSVHICYCFTPMRYIWDMYDMYFKRKESDFFAKTLMPVFLPYLKKWDIRSCQRVDYFIADSKNVQEKIKKFYNRDSEVIYPPVNAENFTISDNIGDFYLVAGAFAPYKRLNLAIEAFNILGYPLKVVGCGQEEKKIKSIAKRNIEFLGWQTDEILRSYYSRCKALIFPGEEDFGIVPLEAMAAGRPVIAYGKGGALETVVPIDNTRNGEYGSGILFYEDTPASLAEAIQKFEKLQDKINPLKIREHVSRFTKDIFKAKIKKFVFDKMKDAKKI
jgi:glycosyltransferase involved in cell wall biosynthesis